MAKALKCDECGEVAEHGAIAFAVGSSSGWIHCAPPYGTHDVTLFGQKRLDHDFCSPECLAFFLNHVLDQEAKPTKRLDSADLALLDRG